MPTQDIPDGQLFSRVYLRQAAPIRDSKRFRTRLYGYLAQNLWNHRNELVALLRSELGVSLSSYQVAQHYYEWNIQTFFLDGELRDVLDSISLVSRLLQTKRESWNDQAWLAFVQRVFQEESLGYRLDAKGGVHYHVDAEFERNRVSALSALGQPRFQAVSRAFEDANKKLDGNPVDTKGAVRDFFEALETLFKLVTDSNQDLTERSVRSVLKPLAQRLYQGIDPSAASFADHLLESFCHWVNAGHRYRHGQNTEEPYAPTLEAAIAYVSIGATYVRWLIEVDLLARGASTARRET